MISWETIVLRLVLASVLGAVIGLERERKNWSAGMRTHMMVCLGAALVIIVSSYGFSDVLQAENITLDPSRVAAQVISGIGFLGAGIIMFMKPGFIRGLTTASGLWTVAAIGLAVGAGLYIAAVATTAIALIILLVLQPLEQRISRKFRHHLVKITISNEADPHYIINHMMRISEDNIKTFSLVKSNHDFIIEIDFENFDIQELSPVLKGLEKEKDVKSIYWTQ